MEETILFLRSLKGAVKILCAANTSAQTVLRKIPCSLCRLEKPQPLDWRFAVVFFLSPPARSAAPSRSHTAIMPPPHCNGELFRSLIPLSTMPASRGRHDSPSFLQSGRLQQRLSHDVEQLHHSEGLWQKVFTGLKLFRVA